jgi:uncharacterized protein with HEPN domain
MSRRDPALALEDMQEAILTIEHYVEGYSFDTYTTDKKTRDAVVRNFEILGEAATHVPEDVRAMAPGIPWNRVTGLRNTIIHHYFGVDHTIVWYIIKEQIPGLKEQLAALIKELSR